jgi:hypothetical protein
LEGAFLTALALTDWDAETILPRGYDGTSASPDFANGAVTGAFSYAAGASYGSGTGAANDDSASGNAEPGDNNSTSNMPSSQDEASNGSGCSPGIECVTVTGVRDGLVQIAANVTIEPYSHANDNRYEQCTAAAHNCLQTYPNSSRSSCIEGEDMCNSFYKSHVPGNIDLSISPSGTKLIIYPDGSATIIPSGQKKLPVPPNGG